MNTISDAYRAFSELFGTEAPVWTPDQLQDWIHGRGLRYEELTDEAIGEAFDEAVGPDEDMYDGRTDHQPPLPQPGDRGYVLTGHGSIFVQLPADNDFGFSIHDDDQEWPGGAGIADNVGWELLANDDPRITAADRERLQWILDEA